MKRNAAKFFTHIIKPRHYLIIIVAAASVSLAVDAYLRHPSVAVAPLRTHALHQTQAAAVAIL